MLKAVTFKAAQNFKANLYALEVRSRFINQSDANGYYDGYGNSLSATVVGTSGITIGSGAFVVQGRMVEVVSSETVSIAYQEGKVGYIICRIETCPAQSTENCSFVARVGSTLSGISLTQENVNQYDAESTNRVYEYPIYSFAMQNTAIQNVVKLISPIKEISEIKSIADTAKSTADAAKSASDNAVTIANNAKSTANQNASDISKIYIKLINLGFKQGTITNFSGSDSSLTKLGNYVVGYITFAANQQTIGTIPSGYRPYSIKTTNMTVRVYNATARIFSYTSATLTFNTDGTIVCSFTSAYAEDVTIIFGWDTTAGNY